jgi:hypothetical protein
LSSPVYRKTESGGDRAHAMYSCWFHVLRRRLLTFV